MSAITACLIEMLSARSCVARRKSFVPKGCSRNFPLFSADGAACVTTCKDIAFSDRSDTRHIDLSFSIDNRGDA